MAKQVRIAINGFGRIGRTFFRSAFDDPFFEFVAVNDLTDVKTLAYLLQYDSVYGRYQKAVDMQKGSFVVDGKKIAVFDKKNPSELPWGDLHVDIVIESTGFFASSEKAQAHLDAGAKRVVITAPSPDVTTALVGVNDDRFSGKHPMTCNASCTTNSVAPVLKILLDTFGIERSTMITVHGYTATQKLVDAPDAKDPRRGRAAAVNIVPSHTGAAEAVVQAIPALEGKFEAGSIRVPTITGSLSVITALVSRNTSTAEVNELFKSAARDARWKKVLKVIEDPIVSTDTIGEPYGAIIDVALTKVAGGNFVTIYSWYDNEMGYAATLVEHVRRVAESI